jgi:hypothetical protein
VILKNKTVVQYKGSRHGERAGDRDRKVDVAQHVEIAVPFVEAGNVDNRVACRPIPVEIRPNVSASLAAGLNLRIGKCNPGVIVFDLGR